MTKKGESGFALLLVFAMAATIALMMYMELPRVAFEAQRNREQLLIDRGEQYKRAIQLYFRKLKTYPPSIDALENTNNIRFLRRRYPDPLTGKDDWRLIHIGPGGVFTDSLTNKPKGNQQTNQNTNTFITENASIGSTGGDQQSSGPGLRRRPSDGGQPQAGTDSSGNPNSGSQPGTDQPQQPPPVDPVTGQPLPATGQPTTGQTPPPPPAQNPGQTPGTPVSGMQGVPGMPFNPGSSQDPSQSSGSGPNQFGQPGTDPSQSTSNQASDLLRNLLTRPRPQTGSDPGMSGPGSITTGSIAGVASKVERHSIKVYNEREKYNEWEFIYDYAKDRGIGQQSGQLGAGNTGFPQQQTGQPGSNTPGFGGQSPFGTQPSSGFGSSGGFGLPPTSGNQQAGPLPPTTPPQ